MSEKLPMIPVVEVRETFTPSELLRSELRRFISPELDTRTAESLRATFLFKSWRRRVMRVEEYRGFEQDRGGSVYQATKLFEKLPRMPIPLLPDAIIEDGGDEARFSRIFFKASLGQPIVQAGRILDAIPSIESQRGIPNIRTQLYVEVAKNSLIAAGDERDALLRGLRTTMLGQRAAQRLYVVPNAISVNNSYMQLTPQDSEVSTIDNDA